MLLHRRPSSSGRLLITITYTLFHPVEGFPVLVKKATTIPRAALGLPTPLPILSSPDPSWFDDAAAALAIRSTSPAVHEKIFIPTIVSMGVLVIFCIYCCYQLILNRDTRGAYTGHILSSPHTVGEQENGDRPLTRGLSKTKRSSVLSASASMPDSTSAGSDMIDRLQRRREEQHLRELPQLPQQQDPSNQGHPYPGEHHQSTPRPSVPGSTGQGVQPQPSHSAHVPTAQSPSINANPSRAQSRVPQIRQSLQQSDPRPGIPHTPSSQTYSTRVSSDVLSYMTPPEARQRPLPSSRPQDYLSLQQPAAAATGSPLHSRPSSTHVNIAPGNYSNASLPSTTNLARPQSYDSQLPGYETRNDDVQGNVTTLHSEKRRSRS